MKQKKTHRLDIFPFFLQHRIFRFQLGFLFMFTFFFLSFSLFLVGWPSLPRPHSLHQLLDDHFQPPPTHSPQEPADPTTAQPSTVAFQPLWGKIKDCTISGSSTWIDILVVKILFNFLLFPRLQFPETEAVSGWRSSSPATHYWKYHKSLNNEPWTTTALHHWSIEHHVINSTYLNIFWKSKASHPSAYYASFISYTSCSICSTVYILPLFHYWSLHYIDLTSVGCSCWPRARSTSVVGEPTLCSGDLIQLFILSRDDNCG